ncbi:MAG: DUF2905 domain-containing protein [Chloroflexota bacterium]|nr:DUF2905 domain-containing protein [Chloroflexota bacterium]
MSDLGRTLIVIGGAIVVVGLVLSLAGRLPWLGNLPGDVAIERDNFRLYVPCGTMILLSILLTIVLNVVVRWLR